MYEELVQYLLSFGFSENDIVRILEKTDIRDAKLVKTKIEAYQELLNLNDDEIRKMIITLPALLSYDTNGDGETSVKGKIEAYKSLLKLNDNEVRKMIKIFPALLDYDISGDNITSVSSKIEAYKNLFNLSSREVRKMIVHTPSLLSLDTYSESETSVKGKIKFYNNVLNLKEGELGKIIKTFPALLNYDTISDKPSSIKTKITKIEQIIPFEEFKEIALQNPMIFAAPAQSFKIRYMIASIMGCTRHFFSAGFITNEKKVWARCCYLREIGNASNSYLYFSEPKFRKQLGVSSEDLMEKYILDEKTLENIERTYYETTGERLSLDSSELENLGLGR